MLLDGPVVEVGALLGVNRRTSKSSRRIRSGRVESAVPAPWSSRPGLMDPLHQVLADLVTGIAGAAHKAGVPEVLVAGEERDGPLLRARDSPGLRNRFEPFGQTGRD